MFGVNVKMIEYKAEIECSTENARGKVMGRAQMEKRELLSTYRFRTAQVMSSLE